MHRVESTCCPGEESLNQLKLHVNDTNAHSRMRLPWISSETCPEVLQNHERLLSAPGVTDLFIPYTLLDSHEKNFVGLYCQ